MTDDRPSLDRIFMNHARDWATRSTCQHLQVGAVLAKDYRTIASGYNGAPPGMPHCEHEDTHLPYDQWEPCRNTNHAEGNVLAFAAKEGRTTDGATLFTTHSPCLACSGLLLSAGIVRVVWEQEYRRDDGAGRRLLEQARVSLTDLSKPRADAMGVTRAHRCTFGPCVHSRSAHGNVIQPENYRHPDPFIVSTGGPCYIDGCECLRFRA